MAVTRDDVLDVVARDEVPRCGRCGGLLKPDVVFFGEPLDAGAIERARDEVRDCEVLLVVGTSVEVEPAASLPTLAASHGAAVWEVNPDPTWGGALHVGRPAEDALPEVVERVRDRLR